ncbi:MAG: acetyl-CoA carboxylase biotin carboxylase subunit [Ardenticatenia bacterium]|nr:acetyl-CoA carboxylase biotin carboxylase subunit [Ardenticatenia bacterium]
MFSKLLVANRGEIAVRIIRACQELGIRTVAVYSEADARALHTLLADEAHLIGPPSPVESYLHAERLIEVALKTGCEAVHPGYGFLAENAAFAETVRAAGLTFVGPPAEAIRLMGDKVAARARMAQADVPVVPGYEGEGDVDEFLAAARALGYPVLVKAAGGGGGRGMRVVAREADLPAALDTARREARNAFGSDRVYLEKYVDRPRHIEFQVLADHHGHVVHLFERECSVQRRHQKIIEESPSPVLDEELRRHMGAAAVAAARAVGYVNAGTVEFLVDAERRFYFLEMNTRLQVEHPVTELVVGVDLVKAQLAIAAGEPLPFTQAELSQRGHAIECRIYAEDPARGFLPATGRVVRAVEPVGPWVRVDAGITTGDTITHYYDPMIAKLIVWGEHRDDALRRMAWALDQYIIMGVTTNITFLRDVVRHPAFQRGDITTDFVERYFVGWRPPDTSVPDEVLIAAALAEQADTPPAVRANHGDSGERAGDPFSPWNVADGFRPGRV